MFSKNISSQGSSLDFSYNMVTSRNYHIADSHSEASTNGFQAFFEARLLTLPATNTVYNVGNKSPAAIYFGNGGIGHPSMDSTMVVRGYYYDKAGTMPHVLRDWFPKIIYD